MGAPKLFVLFYGKPYTPISSFLPTLIFLICLIMAKGFWLFKFVRFNNMAILFDIHKLAKLVESNSCSFLKKYLPKIGGKK